MMNNYFVQSAEIKDKYDGKFKNLEPWKRKFEARLNQRNGLGMPILKGHVPVKKKASPIGTIYVQTKAIFTQILLALEIILTLNSTTVDGFKADEDYELLIDILSPPSRPSIPWSLGTPTCARARRTFGGRRAWSCRSSMR